MPKTRVAQVEEFAPGSERPQLLIDLGHRIRAARRSLGLTQAELGQLAGLHRTYLSQVESGGRNLSLLAVERIARALGVELHELFHQ